MEFNESNDIKCDENVLYINSSKVYFSSISKDGSRLRDIFKSIYNTPVKKYGKRMFAITIDRNKEPITVDQHFKQKAKRKNLSIEKVISTFVINYPNNKNNLLVKFKKEFLEKYITLNEKKSKLTYHNVGLITDKNLFDVECDK